MAATVAAAFACYRASRRLGLLLILPTILLTAGVVYCQMHYAVDAAAGLAVGCAVAWALGQRRSPVPMGAPFREHAQPLVTPRTG